MPSLAIRHATLVTVDSENRVLDDATVTVTDGIITSISVGDDEPTTAAPPDVEEIDARGAIVMPGLINAHTHLAMTMFRGFADDMNLQGFLGRLFPVEERVLSADTIALGARLAFAESFRAGCTAALDMFWWPEITQAEAAAAGFDVQAGPVFIGFPGPDHTAFADRLRKAQRTGPHRWIFAHGTYTMRPDELDEVGRLAHDTGARFHIHASENQSEVDDVRARFGRSPVELLDDHGLLRPGTVLAHAVVLTDAEIERIANTGTAVAHCPLSNLKLASGVCRVPELLAAGATVGLGTDGSASSNDLDLFLAMRIAALLQKGTRLDATVLPAAQVLRLATIDAARALGIDDTTGSIEVGKRADLVLLDADSPTLTPAYDPVSTIVYAASRADVTDVW
ncbi:MAG: amidohydrolase family protein, partial [Ilumatobacteraceae bacterium]